MAAQRYEAPAGAFGCVKGKTGLGGSGKYGRPGRTIERVDEVRYQPGRKGKPSVIIEKTILHVLSQPEKWSGGKPGQQVPMPQMTVGEKVVDFISLNQDYAGDALAAFLQTCFGVAPGSVTEDHVAQACGEGQPCRGFILEVYSEERDNRANTIVYVRTNYERLVPARELADLLDDEGVTALGGADALTAMVARESGT